MAEIQFKQVVLRGCGMDIHKEVMVATVRGEGINQETREFETFTSSLTQLREWLVSLGITHVAMESTGVYWKPIYNIFEGHIPNVWIVNARHIKNVPRHKTDKNDSVWISKLLMAGLFKPSFIPPLEQREFRDLTRYRRKLIQMVAANKNRIRATLVEAAWAASRTKGTFFTKRYHRAAMHRGKKKALIAVRHSLLKCVWHVLTGGSYRELGEQCMAAKLDNRRKEYLKSELKKLAMM